MALEIHRWGGWCSCWLVRSAAESAIAAVRFTRRLGPGNAPHLMLCGVQFSGATIAGLRVHVSLAQEQGFL